MAIVVARLPAFIAAMVVVAYRLDAGASMHNTTPDILLILLIRDGVSSLLHECRLWLAIISFLPFDLADYFAQKI